MAASARPAAGALVLAFALAAVWTAPAESDCPITLDIVQSVGGDGFLDFRCVCGCDALGEGRLAALLRERFGEAGPPAAVKSLFVGRLESQLPRVGQALARAAADAQDWDAGRAWRESGYANGFVRDLLNRQGDTIWSGLSAAFAPWGIALEVVSVEKVLMAVPADLPYGESLLAQGADRRRRLPFDAQVWFRLIRATD